jgi:hypothetical protein
MVSSAWWKTIFLTLALAMAPGCGDDSGGGGGDGDGGAGNGDGGGDNEFNDGGLPASACKKIDLVFSVDPSGSMTDELDAMRTDVFPAFATALIDVGGGLDDYRVGVIDACPDPANYHTRGEATNDCNFQSGEVWMESSSTALVDEFTCVGDIYKTFNCSGDNDDEQPASAALAALEPPYSTNQNAGFLRNDALLVVIAITDEDETPTGSAQTSQQLYDRLVAVKGDVRRMVFLGIGGGLPSGCSNGAYGQADPANLLNDLTNKFIAQNRGIWWDLCVGNLEDGLGEAIAVIESACAEFPPIE